MSSRRKISPDLVGWGDYGAIHDTTAGESVRRLPTLSLAEQESILRWSRAEPVVYMWTASPVEVRKWRRAGYAVRQDGVGWRAEGPKECVRVRKVKDGLLVKRSGRVPNNLPRRDPIPF